MEQYYRIAGLTVCMDTWGRTAEQAEAYRCEKTDSVDFFVEPLWESVKAKRPNTPDELGEYLLSGAVFYKHLLDYNGCMLHSSCVVVDGKAYLFTAHCGTGKSTHTKLWMEMFGDRAFILNDDKPALRLENGIWYAYGTPWSGKYDISVNKRIPVAGIATLERGERNEISRIDGLAAISAIMKQVNRPKSADYRIKLMELLDKLIAQIPIWQLRCNMDLEAAIVSYEAMSGATWKG